ncbi:MAG: hypothetical protein JWO11_1436 [Nocardioides sp.]|nr:hypothetical protein [Nocardioides sp.]
MLCTAMLVGAAASLLLSLRVSRLAKHFAGRQVGNPAIGALTAIRARAGPPYLWDFSVVRC